jgi:hypothetical protein
VWRGHSFTNVAEQHNNALGNEVGLDTISGRTWLTDTIAMLAGERLSKFKKVSRAERINRTQNRDFFWPFKIVHMSPPVVSSQGAPARPVCSHAISAVPCRARSS